MPCETYHQLKREFESVANEVRLFKSPFGSGGTKKEREKALEQMNEERQRAFIAYANHQQNCPECKKD